MIKEINLRIELYNEKRKHTETKLKLLAIESQLDSLVRDCNELVKTVNRLYKLITIPKENEK